MYVLLGGLYLGLRLLAFLPTSARVFPDTGTYMHTAAQPLLSSGFWLGWRTFTVPVFYRLLPDSNAARAAGQLAVSIICWTLLAVVAARAVQRLRLVVFALVLVFSLTVWITQWDSVILSESLGLSLAAAAVAAWILLLRNPGLWTASAAAVVSGLWALVRPENGVLALLMVPLVLVWAVVARRTRVGLILSLVLIAASGVSVLDTYRPGAQEADLLPMLDVIGTRVLPNRGQLAFFRSAGMPTPSVLLSFSGQDIPRQLVDSDPRLAPFRHWLLTDSRQTLAEYLLLHPGYVIRSLYQDDSDLLDPRLTAGYRATGTSAVVPEAVTNVLYPPWPTYVAVWFVLLIPAAVVLARRRAGGIWVLPAAILLLQIAAMVETWAGGPDEMPRHAVTVGMLTKLSLLLVTLFSFDALRRSGRLGISPRSDPFGVQSRPQPGRDAF